MPKASVKRLIECNKEQLVDLVLDIENYPKFIPYCLDAKIYEKKEEKNLILIIADLTIGKGPFKATYKSDVRFNKDTDIIYLSAYMLINGFILFTLKQIICSFLKRVSYLI